MLKLAALLLTAASLAPAADSTLLNLMMPDARVAAGFNLTSTRVSPFGKFLLAQMAQSPQKEFEAFIEATGFDPRRDLDQILIASQGTQGSPSVLALASGKFDPARLTGMAKMAGAEVQTYNGIEIVSVAKGMPFPGALVFLDGNTVAFGDLKNVQGLLDRRQAGSMQKAALTAQAAALAGDRDFWFLSVVPFNELKGALPGGAEGSGMNMEMIKSISQISGGAKFGDVVNFGIEIVSDTAENAAAISGVLKFGLGMLQMQQGKETEQIRNILKALDLKTDGPRVLLALPIPEALIEALPKAGEKPAAEKPTAAPVAP